MGLIVLSGSFEGTISLLGDTLTSSSGSDVFVTKTPVERLIRIGPPPDPPTTMLRQNYPNPFGASTSISFALPEAGPVSLVVYDVRGREVERLVDGWMGTGMHTTTLDASALPSGVYVYRLTAPNFIQAARMVRVR